MDRFPFNPYDFFGYLTAGCLCLFSADMAFGTGDLFGREYPALAFLVLVLLAYVVGHVVATPAAAVLESGAAKRLIGSPVAFLLATRARGRFKRWLFPAYTRPLPQALRDAVQRFLSD